MLIKKTLKIYIVIGLIQTILLVFIIIFMIVLNMNFYEFSKTNEKNQKNIPEKPIPSKIISTNNNPFFGEANAPDTLIEFMNYDCFYCKKFADENLPLLEKDFINKGKLKLVIKHLPNRDNKISFLSSIAAECAFEQGKYKAMHDLLFKNQETHSIDNFKLWAKQIGLDTAKFNKCLINEAERKKIFIDINEATSIGIKSTPTFIINGKLYVGFIPYPEFKKIIEDAVK